MATLGGRPARERGGAPAKLGHCYGRLTPP